MQRIDENTYIDDTLVTCAEYQLFIDEMREQGKYYQPDHWTSYQFPVGKAREPILGVRHSDAVAFCEWLGSREASEWKYRLPIQEEAGAFPVKPVEINPLGYWVNGNGHFTWVVSVPNEALDLDHARFLDIDHTLARTLNLAQVVERDNDFAHILELDLAQDPSLSGDIERDLDRIRNFDPEFDRGYTFNRAFDLASALASVINLICDRTLRILDLEFDLALDLVHDLDCVFDRGYSRGVALIRNLDSGLDRGHIRSLISNTNVDLFAFGERIAGRSPAFEGIRLVKERIR